jgi:hypothetical protein
MKKLLVAMGSPSLMLLLQAASPLYDTAPGFCYWDPFLARNGHADNGVAINLDAYRPLLVGSRLGWGWRLCARAARAYAVFEWFHGCRRERR